MKLIKVALIGLLITLAPFSWSQYDADQAMQVAQLNGIDIAYTESGRPRGGTGVADYGLNWLPPPMERTVC